MFKLKRALQVFIASLVCIVTTFDSELLCQSIPDARLQDDGTIILNEQAPLSDSYLADAKHYTANIDSGAQGQLFLEQLFGKEYISIHLNYTEMQATIKLNRTGSRSLWTVDNWNQYLSTQ